jgi:hypothetical protein
MQTVIETPEFIKHAKRADVTNEELEHMRDFLARTPDAGDDISGAGGARKVRFSGKRKGKSGGYRVITFFSGMDIPVFLLDVYTKGEKVTLTHAEKNALKKLLAGIAEAYRRRKT